MAVRLRQQPFARIDQHDGDIGVRGAGRHVAGILLVAGRIGDDEGARFGGEIAIGDIDGDALLAFGLEAVDEQREVDRILGRAELFRILFERGELVVEDELLLVEKPPDQRRLAVIDRAAGEDAQCRKRGNAKRGVHDRICSMLVAHRPHPEERCDSPESGRLERLWHRVSKDDTGCAAGELERPSRRSASRHRSSGRGIGGSARRRHQKYPSRFFFSIEPASSLSMRRPCRSEVVDLRISAMMSSRLVASDSIAPLSG